jgi:nickel-dependent lactate racemase
LADTIQLISETGIDREALFKLIDDTIASESTALHKVLLVPPDITRVHSRAGDITCAFYKTLSQTCDVDILPALGTHHPMTEAEAASMFPEVPFNKIIHHNWRTDVVAIGEISNKLMERTSHGQLMTGAKIEINRALLSGYDLIVSIGQVVPHEVAGVANYTKNIVVGCGGKSMIDASHMLGAVYGIEKILGTIDNPVRALFDYAQKECLADLPLLYFLTVSTGSGADTKLIGAFAGRTRQTFEAAAALSQRINIVELPEPVHKAIVWLDPKKFKSTWLGNKAIYRTRMMLADGAELLVLAPGVKSFGEDAGNDALIRKYGYAGRQQVLKWLETEKDLQENLSVAAHLIHGSSDGRFKITYAVDHLSRNEIERVNFEYIEFSQVKSLYLLEQLKRDQQSSQNDASIFFIDDPGLALWRASNARARKRPGDQTQTR